MLSYRRVEKGVVRKVGFTLTLLSEPTALALPHRGRGDWGWLEGFEFGAVGDGGACAGALDGEGGGLVGEGNGVGE